MPVSFPGCSAAKLHRTLLGKASRGKAMHERRQMMPTQHGSHDYCCRECLQETFCQGNHDSYTSVHQIIHLSVQSLSSVPYHLG